MILKGHGPMSSQDLASELIRQMDVLREHNQNMVRVESRIQALEQRYGVASAQLHGAIESGAIQETSEVCDWIIDHELFERTRSSIER